MALPRLWCSILVVRHGLRLVPSRARLIEELRLGRLKPRQESNYSQIPRTGHGVKPLRLVPSPSWPDPLDPQHWTPPVVIKAQV